MLIISVMIRQLTINLQVKSDPLIYRKLTLASSLALRPLADRLVDDPCLKSRYWYISVISELPL